MKLADLVKAIEGARDAAKTLNADKPHSGSGLLAAVQGKMQGALDVLESHVRWLASGDAAKVPPVIPPPQPAEAGGPPSNQNN